MSKSKLELAKEFLEDAQEQLANAEDVLNEAQEELYNAEAKIQHWKREIADQEEIERKEFERLNPRLFDIKVTQ